MKKLIILFLAACFAVPQVGGQQIAPFREGDRAVFLGNSITDGGRYHSYIWLYYMTRFPDMDLRVLNAGIGGDTAENMFNRLDGDVFAKRPTVLTVTFGMNDSGYFEYNGDDPVGFGNRQYQYAFDNYKKIEERLKALPDTRIVLMGSSPYDETAVIEDNEPLRGKNDVMRRIVEFQRASALENGWEFIDLNEPMTELNQRMQRQDPSFALMGGDRIHPETEGHMVMAYLYLKAQGMAGREVAAVEIDGRRGELVQTANAEVSDLYRSPKEVSFTYLAGALPYPVDPITRGWNAKRSQADALEIIPFTEEMNREILKVTGLSGKYRLTIDGQEIGTWSAAELAAGINLAEQTSTPQYQQAMAVLQLNEQRWEIERKFRELAWVQYNFLRPLGLLDAFDVRSLQKIEEEGKTNGWVAMHRDIYSQMMHEDVRRAREEQMELLIDKIYKINKPVERKVVLKKL